MKKYFLLTCLLVFVTSAFSQVTSAVGSISPTVFEETQSVTVTFTLTTAVTTDLYLWAWAQDINGAGIGTPNNGTWTASATASKLTQTGAKTYIFTLTPSVYFNITGIKKMGFLAKTLTGSAKSADFFPINVGAFQATLTAPALNSTTIINAGASLSIAANNTSGNASYNLLANGVSINTFSGTTYTYTDLNIQDNKGYDLQVTQGTTTFSNKFSVIVNPGIISATMPTGLEDGINYNSSDATKATLVLTAPGKDFVYVAGTFNNYTPTSSYAMKKDGTTGKFWLELTGLTSGTSYNYQYWVVDQTPTTNSPVLVKCADPFSTLVLSPYDDPYIPAGNYPNMPVYPSGQQYEVSVLQTGQTPYNWQITNFTKPEKENLVVYELLVRDFDANRSFQNLINRIDYFKNLKINAIELMPVMEFEGDESWGYNTSFHLALDKAYGTASKFKEFIDLCHQNGIAVILDVALNHAFGRNPMVRMWMNDATNSGYGGPASDNPYFNVTATHSYSVGNDFNHSSAYTKYYVKRVIKQWISEFHIDGFRWDLTKGFTQNCTGSDACTNSYQQDRVDILKDYVDYSWGLDPTHYAIFEHLGADNEEQQWANYRTTETPSKGVMMWSEMTTQYAQLLMGYATNSDISRMGNGAHGFNLKRVMGYPESHDKERLMYSAKTYGNSTNSSYNVKTLTTTLSRMPAIGAVSLLIPGPKMIWHFAELGNDTSIFTCYDGTINTDTDAISGDCKLDKKQQLQWTNNWLADANRSKIYADWSKMIDLKKSNPVFKGDYSMTSGASLTQRIYVYNNSFTSDQLKNVVILSNFDVNSQNITPNFPYTGTWYNLMDNSTINVTSTTAQITIEAGGYRIYGNKPPTLDTDKFETMNEVSLYPNPTSDFFIINAYTNKVQIFSIAGQLVKTFDKKSNDYQYEISDLKNGVYLVKATDENNREKTLKLIKQ